MASMKVRRAALKAIEDKYGRVTAAKLVEESRSARHPLHKEFMWDDEAGAAHQHRLNIARHIISSVRVVTTHNHITLNCVGYLRDADAVAKNKAGYRSTVKIASDRDLARESLHREIQSIQSAVERATEIAAMFDLQEELHDALEAAIAGTGRARRGPGMPDEEGDRPTA